MKDRYSAKSLTPLGPPLTGGKLERAVDMSPVEETALSASPFKSGGRGDNSQVTSGKAAVAPPLFEEGSQLSCGVPDSIPLAGARGGREGLAFVSYDKNLTVFARENRKHPTVAESKLWYQLLRMRNLSAYKFTRQKPVLNFIVDFYCAELRLAIELDGDSHAESVVYDAERTRILSRLGVTVVRYANDDILNNLQGVYVDLMRRITSLEGAA